MTLGNGRPWWHQTGCMWGDHLGLPWGILPSRKVVIWRVVLCSAAWRNSCRWVSSSQEERGPYLFSTVKSRGKREGVADAQMLSSESVIKPFPRVASPPEGCLRITVSLLNGGTPVFKPLNDLWWGEPWQVYFSSTPRILMSPCSYLWTPWCGMADS